MLKTTKTKHNEYITATKKCNNYYLTFTHSENLLLGTVIQLSYTAMVFTYKVRLSDIENIILSHR